MRIATDRPGRGRPLDRTNDGLIVEAAIDLLAERPFERITMDDVAARAGKAKTTVYRRWASKDELVLAVVRTIGQPPEARELPDHGFLRPDLLAVIDSPWLGGLERRVPILAGLVSAAGSSHDLADTIRSEITEPYVDIYRRILERAVDRGEVPAHTRARVPILAQVIPAMSTYRLSGSGVGPKRRYFVGLVDDVVLPALSAPVLPEVCSARDRG